MNNLNLKTHYSAQELALLSLSCLPNSKQGVIYQANKLGWTARKRTGRGGGLEYELASLPKEIQTELQARFTAQLMQAPKSDLALSRENLDVKGLTDKQREVADARIALVAYVIQFEQVKTRQLAVQAVVDMAKTGTLPEHLSDLVAVANAKKGEKRTLSQRTLMQWVVDYHKCESMTERLQRLAPLKMGQPEKDVYSLPWLHDFLPFYQMATSPSLAHAYKRFANSYQGEIPSLHQVRRYFDKLPQIVVNRGRMTGAAYKQVLPFVRRDWSKLGLFDCYIGDGHGFKAKVRHPDHAHGFQPEVTALIDGRTRLIVGWSVAKSESVLAVADAMRHAIERHGIPLIYYSDNGRGEKNLTLDAEITGLFPRLGITHETGIAGNPQGRGIIERLWKSTLIPLAREYETSTVKTMDKSTAHLNHRKLESAVNAIEKGKALTAEQQRFYNKMPRFDDFLADVERVFGEYNQHPHSELPRKPDGKHFSPLEYKAWIEQHERVEQRLLTDFERELLFRPEEIRVARRGEVELHNHIYFSLALADFHGDEVRVCYDIHDPSYVFVKTLDGRWIGRAELDGNKRDAMPQSLVERAREKSIEAANKRLAKKIDRNNRELNPVRTIEHNEGAELLHGLRQKATLPNWEEEPMAMLPSELKRQQRKHA